MENAEINNIIKIVGLQYKKNYEDRESLKSLRYGKIMIMTDQVRFTQIRTGRGKSAGIQSKEESATFLLLSCLIFCVHLYHSVFQWVVTCFQIGKIEGELPSCYLLVLLSADTKSFIHSFTTNVPPLSANFQYSKSGRFFGTES